MRPFAVKRRNLVGSFPAWLPAVDDPSRLRSTWEKMRHKPQKPIDGVVVAGLAELALGALTGWPYALAIADPERAKKVGIRSTARLRQWHLDLIALGGLTALAPTAVPDLPRSAAVPLAVGAWTNANAFGVLVFRPDWKDHPVYRAGVAGSFAATSWGFCGLAAVGAKRWWKAR